MGEKENNMNKNELATIQSENEYLKNRMAELTTVEEKYNNSIIAKLDGKYAMSNFGLKDNRLEHDGNKYTLTLKSEDGKSSIVKVIELSDNGSEAVETIGALQNLNDTATIANAWNIAKLRTVAKNNGFKSVGEFVNAQFPKLTVSYANQLANAADIFLHEVDGKVCYKYAWCEDVAMSNLTLIVGKWNEFHKDKTSVDESGFYDEYIKPDDNDNVKLPVNASQNVLKKAISALNESSGKGTRKSSKTTTEKPEMDVKTCLANVVAWFEENNDLDNEVAKTYLDVMASVDAMIDRLNKKDSEKTA